MAAAADRPVHVPGQSNSNAGCQPTSRTVQAAHQPTARGPFPMMMPWMPMMMPPWMPMFGMLPGNKGTLAPPMSMPMALPGMMGPGRQAAPSASAAAQKAAATPAAASTALKPSAATTAAAAAAADPEDEELGLKPDEEVTVEPEELAVFEKVAAMEREQKQQKQQEQQEKFERASSPSGSCHTTVNGGSNSAPCSPMSAMQPMPFPPGMGCFPFPGFPCMPMGPMPGCFPAPAQAMQQQHRQPQLNQQPMKQQPQQGWQRQAQQLWKPQQQQGGDADAAPVPWTSFAADDCGDDLDKDLQELIMLPADCMQQAGVAAAAPCADAAAAAPAPCPAAAAKARSSSLKRIGSTASAVSAADAVYGVLGQSPANGSKAKRVVRIRSNSKGSAPSSGSTGRIVLKGSTAKRNGSSQQQQGAGALGVSKGAVQKKVAVNTVKTGAISSSHAKASAVVQGPAQGAGLQLPAPAPQEQQQAVSKGMVDEDSLCLLGDLDSSLSGGDAMTAGVMPADDYWDSFMQEASDDGWDSLLGNTELDFVTAGL